MSKSQSIMRSMPKVAKRKSEYGSSFTIIDSAFEEYHERLNFRLHRRTSEYIHQPLSWDSPEEFDEIPEIVSNNPAVNSCAVACAPVTSGDTLAVSSSGESYEKDQHRTGAELIKMKDSFTQTRRIRGNEERKVFAPYALGSCADSKSTFNVNSSTNVYPSALRAKVKRESMNRRQASRLPTYSGPFNSGHHKLEEAITKQPYSRGAEHSVGIDLTNSKHSSMGRGDWTTEYNRQYSVYPASAYARSASLVAGRCRPLSSQYNVSNRNRFLSSLANNGSALVSSRDVARLRNEMGSFRDRCGTGVNNNNYNSHVLAAS